MKQQKPKHFLVLRTIGIVAVALAVFGIYLSINGFGDFETNNFMIGGILTSFGFFIGIPCLLFSFAPNIAKLSVKTTKYIQNETKDDLKEIATTSADIASDAITITARAAKEGFADTVFCKYCGKQIDADSRFCSFCGKEL